jgi:hypothetical protein
MPRGGIVKRLLSPGITVNEYVGFMVTGAVLSWVIDGVTDDLASRIELGVLPFCIYAGTVYGRYRTVQVERRRAEEPPS